MLPYQDIQKSPEERTADLLARMTVEEKIGQLVKMDGFRSYTRQGDEFCFTERFSNFSEKWIPLVNAYLARHPYAPQPNNLFYYATRCVYGIPAKDDIQQEDAIHLARQATVTLGASLDTLERRPVECLFDITDPQNPLWKIVVMSAKVNRNGLV